MAFAASYTFWQLAHTEHYARDSLSDLTTAFEAVRHPDEAQHSDALNAVSKLIFQAVSVNFITRMDTNQIISFYQSSLPKLGWKLVKREYETLGNKKLTFCLNDMNLNIEIIGEVNTSQTTRYYFGIHRENGPNIKTGCH